MISGGTFCQDNCQLISISLIILAREATIIKFWDSWNFQQKNRNWCTFGHILADSHFDIEDFSKLNVYRWTFVLRMGAVAKTAWSL